MYSESEIFKGVILSLLAYWLIKFIIYESQRENVERKIRSEIKINKEKEEERKIQIWRDFLDQAIKLLPDYKSAFKLLASKYGSNQLMQVIGVSGNEITLLKRIHYECELIELPNMQTKVYGKKENRIKQSVYDTNTKKWEGICDDPIDSFLDEVDFYGIDAYSQEPTVQTLQGLLVLGHVVTEEKITSENNLYTCSLTESGKVILELIGNFPNDKIHLYEFISSDTKERSGIKTILERILISLELSRTNNDSSSYRIEPLRSAHEIIEQFNISQSEYDNLEKSYKLSLGLSSNIRDWNSGIDELAASINALSKEEILVAKENIDRAVINRIILRLSM